MDGAYGAVEPNLIKWFEPVVFPPHSALASLGTAPKTWARSERRPSTHKPRCAQSNSASGVIYTGSFKEPLDLWNYHP